MLYKKRSCRVLVDSHLISQVLTAVPLGQCLTNPLLKSKESLSISEIIANDSSIKHMDGITYLFEWLKFVENP